MCRGIFIDLCVHIRKDKMLIINNLSFYFTRSSKKISKLKSKKQSEENKEHEVKKQKTYIQETDQQAEDWFITEDKQFAQMTELR